MNFWDQRFAEPGYKYGTEPNVFLQQQAARLAPVSQVLVPGDGEGRNGVWLSGQGHGVTSVDSSAVGLQKAIALAQQRGLALNTQVVDLANWVPQPQSYDAVVLIFTHLPDSFRQQAHRRLATALRSGAEQKWPFLAISLSQATMLYLVSLRWALELFQDLAAPYV